MDVLDRVDVPNEVVKSRANEVRVCRDVFRGTTRMREMREMYLPLFPGEKKRPAMYEARLQRTVLFNALQRTVQGLVGMMFRVDPVLEDDVPKEIAGDKKKANEGGHWENIDLQGTHGDVFLREMVAVPALVQGLAGILVDYPPVGVQLDLGTERSLNLRPYWVPIEYHQVVSFRVGMENGRLRLTQLVLRFDRYEPRGEFVDELVHEYRVYRHPVGETEVRYEVWVKRETEMGDPVLEQLGIITNQEEIPIAWCYAGDRCGILDVQSPMLDMAYTNIAHYATRSDHRTSLHYASVPVPVFIGASEPEGDKVVGSAWAEYLPLGADFKYVEHQGSALNASRQELEDLKGEMATLGLAMLQRDTRAAETAEGKRIDRAASDSALAAFARSLQDCAEQALYFHAKYLGKDDGGSLQINRNFEALRLEPADVQTYSNLVASGQLSLDTMWTMFEHGGWLPEDFDPDVEREKVQEAMLPEMPSTPVEMPPMPPDERPGEMGPPDPVKPERI